MPDRDPINPTRKRVLVADDEPHIRRILATFLDGAGFEVDEAVDGAEAMARLEGTSHYDLALLDIMMPE